MNNIKRLKLYWIRPGGYSYTRESLSMPAYHRDDVDAVIAALEAEIKWLHDKWVQAMDCNNKAHAHAQALKEGLAALKDREQRLKEWIDKIDDEIGWNHENDEIGQAVDDALTKVVKQFCTVWSEGIDSCPACGSFGSCKHREQEKQP